MDKPYLVAFFTTFFFAEAALEDLALWVDFLDPFLAATFLVAFFWADGRNAFSKVADKGSPKSSTKAAYSATFLDFRWSQMACNKRAGFP